MTIADVLASRRVVILLGTGGVGKTTLAAATAVAAARSHRTLVVTIDPANRLASALRLEMGHKVTKVRPGLDAVMVDTKVALDELLRRYAPSHERLQRIFSMPLYQHMSGAITGSEEFAAMGLLHEFVATDAYDRIIVDTPPSTHAIDFLTVNRRLIRVFDSGAARVMFKPGTLFALAGGRVVSALSRWTSREYLDDVAYFMTHFEEMFQDMERRVRAMEEVLRDPTRTAVGLVTVPDPGTIQPTLRLVRALHDTGFAPAFTVANRVWPPLLPGPAPEGTNELLDHYAAMARIHQRGVLSLQESLGRTLVVPVLPDLAGLPALEHLADLLLGTDKAK